MLRTALQPRWLALLALVIGMSALFGWLGSWQLGVARDKGAQAAAREVRSQPVAPIDQVLQPQRAFPAEADFRRVIVRGSYEASRHVLVPQRLQRGRPGWWVVTALRTDAGALLPVVRGWVASPDDATAAPGAVPSGVVGLTGVLQPDDPPSAGSALPAGQVGQLDAAELVNRWGGPIYNGYLVVSAETGAGEVGVPPQPERAQSPALVPQGISWRNAAYSAQWWAFAAFAFLLWWKMVRQDQLDRSTGRSDVNEKVAVS